MPGTLSGKRPAVGPIRLSAEILRGTIAVAFHVSKAPRENRAEPIDNYLSTGDMVANFLHVSFERIRHEERRGSPQFEIRPVDDVVGSQAVIDVS